MSNVRKTPAPRQRPYSTSPTIPDSWFGRVLVYGFMGGAVLAITGMVLWIMVQAIILKPVLLAIGAVCLIIGATLATMEDRYNAKRKTKSSATAPGSEKLTP